VGSDGHLWLTEYRGHRIGRLTADGALTWFPVPTPDPVATPEVWSTGEPFPRGGPLAIVAGPDGALWFTVRSYRQNYLGRITTTGDVTLFSVGPSRGDLGSLAVGPDRALWFTDCNGRAIGRLSPDGALTRFGGVPSGPPTNVAVAGDGTIWFAAGNSINRLVPGRPPLRFALPGDLASERSIAEPTVTGLAAAADGSIWLTETTAVTGWATSGGSGRGLNLLGRLAPDGTLTETPIPSSAAARAGFAGLTAIGALPDGSIWFSQNQRPWIGQVAPDGTLREFALPEGHYATGFAAGPDGAVWFTETGGGVNSIGRVGADGQITRFEVPADGRLLPEGNLVGLVAGPDGALWFTQHYRHRIGRLTTAGELTEYPIPTRPDPATERLALPNPALPPPGAAPTSITVGADGVLWFTETGVGRVGRLTTAGEFRDFPVPASPTFLSHITAAPDGALWIADLAGGQLWRLTFDGEHATFTPTLNLPLPNRRLP